MAARTRRPFHDQKTREKIRVSQLVNVLEKHALKGSNMTPDRIKAAEILLKKSLPDLTATEMTVEGGENPLQAEVKFIVCDPDE